MPSRSQPLQLELFPSGGDLLENAPAPPVPTSEKALRASVEALLHIRLDGHLGGVLRKLTLTDNRTRIVSAAPSTGSGLEVRIHRCFAGAPDTTLEAVAAFLLSRRRGPRRQRALATIREHFQRHGPEPASAPKRPRAISLDTAGRCFDLLELRDEINRAYFGGELEVSITWGRRSSQRRKPRRRRARGVSIRLGSYDERRNLVRIHRCLDHPRVPRYVVESVVHHEMVHATLPVQVVNGRRRIHTPEFRRRERLFRHHEEATRWIAGHLDWLARRR